MEGLLYDYDVNRATWFYLSLLLIVAIYFRFNRLWSLRNLDLVLLQSPAPGLILVHVGHPAGYPWLFAVTGLLLVRLVCDSWFQRRPRLEQNLNPPGLAFLGATAFAFLTAIVLTHAPPASSVETVRRADDMLHLKDRASATERLEGGPASSLLAASVVPISNAVANGNDEIRRDEDGITLLAARIMAILCHAAVVGGLIALAKFHFGDLNAGVSMAALYLLLPCTSYDVGRVNHVLPAALVLWAFVAWRRPIVAGSLMGLACGALFFPVFLLPLWARFYGRRRALRFGLALAVVGAVLLGSLVLTASDPHSFARQVLGSIDWSVLRLEGEAVGFWSLHQPAYRIPVMVAFFALLVGLTVWPRRPTFEHLLSHSTAIIVATQFWYPQQGGVYVLWYLPLLLVVVFRPRLAHLLPSDSPPPGLSEPAPAPAPRELVGAGSAGRQLFR